MKIKNLEELAVVNFSSFTLGELLTELLEQGEAKGKCAGFSAWHLVRQTEIGKITEAVKAEILRRFAKKDEEIALLKVDLEVQKGMVAQLEMKVKADEESLQKKDEVLNDLAAAAQGVLL